MVQEYLHKITKFIYKEIAKELNQMYLGSNAKTAPLATGLFLKLPINIQLIQQQNVNYDDNNKPFFSAYTKIDNEVEVYIDFFYSNEKDLSKLFDKINDLCYFWAYVYQHELLHILLKHVTKPFYSRMLRIVRELKPDMNEYTAHSFINNAEDYFINYSISDLVTDTSSKGLNYLLDNGLYNSTYHNKGMSDIEILRDLLKNSTVNQQQLDNNYILETTIDSQKNQTAVIKPISNNSTDNGDNSNNPSNTVSEDIDSKLVDLAQSINSTIQSSAKGSKSATITAELFNSIQVSTNWFKKLKTSFKRDVYYMTSDFYTKWTNLNNKYRQIFKSPKKYYLDYKLEIVLSIDQSGSMPQDSLQKLLYVLEEEGAKISKLTVLIHDTDISKEFLLESDYDITTNSQFKEALATRYQSGGTSHDTVFKWLQSNIKDSSKTIYISFSDNYSDIEETFFKYPVMRKIKSYLVCPVNNPIKVPAINITME